MLARIFLSNGAVMLYGMLAITEYGLFLNSESMSCCKMSPSISWKFFLWPKSFFRILIVRGSSSTAVMFAFSFNSAVVKKPRPGPISRMFFCAMFPASSKILSLMSGFVRKFCPSDFFANMLVIYYGQLETGSCFVVKTYSFAFLIVFSYWIGSMPSLFNFMVSMAVFTDLMSPFFFAIIRRSKDFNGERPYSLAFLKAA